MTHGGISSSAASSAVSKQLDAMMELAADGILLVDEESLIVSMNHTAEELLGRTKREALGRPFAAIVQLVNQQGEQNAEVVNRLTDTFSTTKKIELTTFARSKKGKVFPVRVTGIGCADAEGSQLAIFILRDLTEEQSVDTAKNEFLALASHQLRTPLAAVKWFSDMLLQGDAGQLTAEQNEYVSHIATSNARLADLVNTMLLVSNLEFGDVATHPQAMDIAKEAHELLQAELSASMAHNKLYVKESYDERLPKIYCDPAILRTLLRNIITNAVKYTPQKGHFSVEITPLPLKDRPEPTIAIIVSDNGYGIPKSAQDKVFSKFFRAQNIRDKDTDGTGLGLYIVKTLLMHIGGTISFNSTEGVGSTFVVELPVHAR